MHGTAARQGKRANAPRHATGKRPMVDHANANACRMLASMIGNASMAARQIMPRRCLLATPRNPVWRICIYGQIALEWPTLAASAF